MSSLGKCQHKVGKFASTTAPKLLHMYSNYYKKYAYALAHDMSFVYFSLFRSKNHILKQIFVNFMFINFLVWTLQMWAEKF